jgi:hypothetical protein
MSAETATMEERVRLLEDERDILRTLYAYGHAIDYGLEADFLDCWAEDAELSWGDSTFRGRTRILDVFLSHTHAPAIYHKHFLVEPRVRIEGDRATVESMFARLDSYPDGPKILAFGRYRDVLVRCTDARWRFAERRAEIETAGAPPEAVVKLMAGTAPV